jgi:hypothetical protein
MSTFILVRLENNGRCEKGVSLGFLSFPLHLHIMAENKRKVLDSADKITLILPLLGFSDVLSTLYVQAMGYPLGLHEFGFFASFFVSVGLTHFYAVVYLLILGAFAYFVWFIKNEELNPFRFFDKAIFVLLVSVVCYIFLRLTAVVVGNLLLFYFVIGKVSSGPVIVLTYLSTAFALAFYLKQDVVKWVKSDGAESEQ